jgi:protein kinase-like protein
MERMISDDPYVGVQPITNYYLREKVGEGRIGSVYRAERPSDPPDTLACKVIPEGKLKAGWQKELQKVVLLRSVPNVVQYYGQHGSALDNHQRPFTWVLWNFVDGINLRQYVEKRPWPLDLAFIENIAETVLKVLFACRQVGIQHGDLHEGNILISNPDPRLMGSPRIIWVSDFGYGGSHNELEPRDDFRQLFSIISVLTKKLEAKNLGPRDRVMCEKIDEFLRKRVLEVDPTQGHYVGNPASLLSDFAALGPASERESAAAHVEAIKEPGDYLVAEAIGYRVEEWRNLFVPEFLAAQDLLSRNITVLTGARGCGKTMAFRRLTYFMDKVIGVPSGVKGADQFIGFYMNCRDLVEAFPWLPPRLNQGMEQQIVHYFHLAWFSEVCRTLAIYEPGRPESFGWLDGFLAGIFGDKYHSLPKGADVLAHVRAFLEDEKERCRVAEIGKTKGLDAWPLARVDLLDILQAQLESHIPWIGERPLYLFLDDYTIPIVQRAVQRLLNPIVFKRRSKLFFKVSTEAANSFDREGLRGKPLELHQDFELIDLATESLHQDKKAKTELLDKIFRPRINRHPIFEGRRLGLADVLGKPSVSNNQLARQMRATVEKGGRRRLLYHGAEAFVGVWASDIRIMIQMFSDMLREANGALMSGSRIIDKTIQDKIYKSAGGEFLAFAESVNSPSFWETGPASTKPGESYGKHLRDIAEAFINTTRYELTKGKLVSNQGKMNPKQAFRLEIIDKFELTDRAMEFYKGLVRWHIFLQDWRGKSIRGMITPRLYLNRVLLPFADLTFSSHDNIPLTNKEFVRLLVTPKEFFKEWKDKQRRKPTRKTKRASATQPTLWDQIPKRGKKR